MEQPNPIQVLISVIRALITTATPQPAGRDTVSHDQFAPVLRALEQGGLPAAADWEEEVATYLDDLSAVDPSNLVRDRPLEILVESRAETPCDRDRSVGSRAHGPSHTPLIPNERLIGNERNHIAQAGTFNCLDGL